LTKAIDNEDYCLPPAQPLAAVLVAGICFLRLRLIRDLHTTAPGPCPTGVKAQRPTGARMLELLTE